MQGMPKVIVQMDVKAASGLRLDYYCQDGQPNVLVFLDKDVAIGLGLTFYEHIQPKTWSSVAATTQVREKREKRRAFFFLKKKLTPSRSRPAMIICPTALISLLVWQP